MDCILDGREIRDIRTFIAELESEIRRQTNAEASFGWDLHSLSDALCGGYGGTPPFCIRVEHANSACSELGHAALVAYCDEMLETIAKGGRGMVQRDSQAWFAETKAKAEQGAGPTLLDLLLDAVEASSSRIVLVSSDGRVIADSQRG